MAPPLLPLGSVSLSGHVRVSAVGLGLLAMRCDVRVAVGACA